jgi:carbonic anhydrase
VVGDAWQRGQSLALHGWIYGVHDGRVRDLSMTAEGAEEALRRYEASTTAG